MSLLFFDAMQNSTIIPKPEWSGAFTDEGGGRDGVSNGSGGLHSNANRTLTLPSSAATIIVGFAYYVQNFGWSDIPIQFNNAGGANQASLRINTSGFIEVYRGGTLIGTSSGHSAITTSSWHFIEVKITLTTATSSTVTVRLDGVTRLTITGVATAASTGNVTSLTIQGVGFGSNGSYWDDWYICDAVDATATQGRANNDFLGDCTVQVLLPTAAGDTTQMTPSTGANYTTVDENPPNTSDYVSDAVSGHRDLYNVADLTGTIGAVYGVRESIYVTKVDIGTGSVKPVLKENSVVTADTAQSPASGSWVGVHGAMKAVRPSDSAVWTATDVNNLQIGVEVG